MNKYKEICQAVLTGERARFKAQGLKIHDTIFTDGESPLKESEDIELFGSSFKWKYPLWYAKNLTLINCRIESLQGMCYIENLVMKNCKLLATTQAFKFSSVDAQIDSYIDSVMNPTSGVIRAKAIGELIMEKDKVDPSKTKIICTQEKDEIKCECECA